MNKTSVIKTQSRGIAIVGIGCRFPGGANSPDQLWKLLCDGKDVIVDVPNDRWETDRFFHADHSQPGRHMFRQGGFVTEIDKFDARFFGISPREAVHVDPQQRFMLEVAWEALEDAGIPADCLAGSNTGVFVGISSYDYYGIQTNEHQLDQIDTHTGTGGAMSVAANRLSYVYDLRGPSVSVDTACSSSLVATHLACAAIERGECDIALAGGVNLILAPYFTMCLSQAGMLSPRWRSRSFDAGADGYVRGEGAGVVVLKGLDEALRDGDRVYAVIRGTAVNQDGRTPGMTVPSAAAQCRAIEAACERAGISPGEVGYVEAHGTGTPVGDPLEAEGLSLAFCQERDPGRPLIIGSIKSNIGHLESAAGVAGLIKAALVVERGRIPRIANFESPNPRIPMADLGLLPADRELAFPTDTRLAGVNSFGFGGTNAHALLEGPPVSEPSSAAPPAPWILPVSARSAEALPQVLAAWEAVLESGEDAGILCATAARRRDHHGFRRAFVGADAEALRAALADARGEDATGSGAVTPQRVVFAFCGQGPQWWAMGRELFAQEPVFRAEVERCDAIMRKIDPDWSLVAEMHAEEASSRMHDTDVLQPALFAMQVGLAALWRSWGIEPAAVVGHSMGEIAAAHIAGALTLEDAARVILLRGRIQAGASAAGGMAFVSLPPDRALAAARQVSPAIEIGAYNSPAACTLSGDRAALEELMTRFAADGVFARMVRVNCACHSSDMEPLKTELIEILRGIEGRATEIPFYSTVTGTRMAGTELGTEYWWRNFREPVAFMQAAASVLADGYETFIELAPHPVLVSALRECFSAAGKQGVALPSILRDKPERAQMLDALAKLYERGVTIDWNGVYPGRVTQRALPRHPWQREAFWNEGAASRRTRLGIGDHPLLERRLGTSSPAWETRLDRPSLAWVKDHGIMGEVVMPGAAYVEAALAAARVEIGTEARLEEVELRRVLVLPVQPRVMQVALSPGDRRFTVTSRTSGEDGDWIEHAVGRYAAAVPAATRATRDLAAVLGRCTRPVDVPALFSALVERGYDYGPTFRGLAEILCGDHEYIGRVEVPAPLADSVPDYRMHPAVLDACLQVMLAHSVGRPDGRTVLPVGLGRVELHAPMTYPMWAHARIVSEESDGFFVDLDLLDAEGGLIAQIIGLRARAVAGDARTDNDADTQLYAHRWMSRPLPGDAECAPAGFFPSLQQIAEAARPRIEALVDELERDRWYKHVRPRIDALCTTYAARALVELGADPTAPYLPDDIAAKVVPARQALYRKLLTILEEGGVLVRDGQRYRIERRPADLDSPIETWRSLLWDHPDNIAELDLLRRCGGALAQVLSGGMNPLQVIFPDGSLGISTGLFQDAPVARVYNLVARSVVADLVKTLPEGRTLRVLEIGAGTGGLTAHLVGALPAGQTRYYYTDVSQHFLHGAQDRFKDYGFLDYGILDIDRDPAEQGIEPGSFDLVVASDAVHATPDLRRSLRHARQMLAPGGLLLLVEAMPPSRMLDVTFGLTDGWWAFTDADLRTNSPLMLPARWDQALREAGFAEMGALMEAPEGEISAQAVILARNPAEAKNTATVPIARLGRWLVCADRGDVAERFAARLRAIGHEVALLPASTKELPLDPLPTDIAGFWALDEAPASSPDALRAGCLDALSAMQQIAAKESASPPRLWCITAGAWAEDTDAAPGLHAAALWGLGTTAINELPRQRITLVDLPGDCDDASLDRLIREASVEDNGERALRLRAGSRLARRLVRVRPEETLGSAVTENTALRAGLTHLGSADSLTLRRVPRQAPGDGEIEIETRVTSLNFRDLMVSLGFVQSHDGGSGDLCPGAEGAGHVVAVGPGVTEVRVGDRVAFLAPKGRALATHVTAPAVNVYPIPDALDFTSAAGLPTVYLTALIALREFARVRPGETVLVHGGSGGLGLATLQVAQMLGAEVFATAGSHEKREFLRALGVKHVMDSRRLDFGDEIRALTAGRGVDVVINSVTGDAMTRSIACLAPYGRFIEVGKRDLQDNTRVGLRPFARNIAYYALDVSTMIVDRPEWIASLIGEIFALVAEGRLRALPSRTYPLTESRAALRSFGAAKHVGKILVSPAGISKDERILPLEQALRLRADGTYLVTGGLGGFGLATAQWLAEHGAGRLVLASRRGALEADALERLRATGADVRVEAVDISDGAAVEALVARAHTVERPLRGVFHAAMVLEDLPVQRLDAQSFERVFAPKARGALHLHEHTSRCPLDLFVLFSSASALVGTPGQANYVAANAFLDALAQVRRSQGLPALAINWGMLREVGYVARTGTIAKRLETQGMLGFPPAWALAAMERFIGRGTTQVGLLKMDWGRWLATGNDQFTSNPQYELLRAEVLAAGTDADDGADAGGSVSFEDRLHAHVARVLGLPAARLDRTINLSNAGLDSLLAAEISAWIRREAGVEFSVMTLMKGPSVAQLAAEIEKQRKASGPQTEAATEPSPDDPTKTWSTHFRPAASPPRNAGGPLSFTEQRLSRWMDHEPARPTHCLYFPIQLSGEVDDAVMEAALRDVIARQESLRTRFVKIDGQWQREVAADVAFTLSRRDLREFPEAEREAALRKRAAEIYMTPVDPTRAPLLFVELIRTADHESVLLLQISHMISDGWSMGVLLHELKAHYNARKKGITASVPPLLVQPLDYARWEQAALSAEALEAAVEKARKELVPLQFPLDRRSPDKRGPECGRIDVRIDDTLRARLAAVSQREGVPMVAAMVTAFQFALYDFTQQSTLSFSISNANRQMQHTQELIGFFAYSYVHQSEVGPLKDQPLALLRQNNERLNQITFEDRLKILLQSSSDRILLNYINFAWEFDLVGLTPRYRPDLIPNIHIWALHDLALDVVDLKEALTLTFWFTPEVLDEATVARFAERFREGLKRLC